MPRQLTIRNLPDAVATRLERLARYVTWTDEDVSAFNDALRAQRTIDDDIWR